MNRFRFFINVNSPNNYDSEEKLKLLTQIREALQEFCISKPELKISISNELTDDNIAHSLNLFCHKKKNDLENVKLCKSYDFAQGRNLCYNTKTNSKTCNGICDFYDE
jgi:hypothetical protein